MVGTDSHTPVVNGLAVFGWGVGGIEATTALLGQPIGLLPPRVVGCRLTGAPPPGVLAADIPLSLTERLRPADDLRPQPARRAIALPSIVGLVAVSQSGAYAAKARETKLGSPGLLADRRPGKSAGPATSNGVVRWVKAQNRATEAYGVAP